MADLPDSQRVRECELRGTGLGPAQQQEHAAQGSAQGPDRDRQSAPDRATEQKAELAEPVAPPGQWPHPAGRSWQGAELEHTDEAGGEDPDGGYRPADEAKGDGDSTGRHHALRQL